MSARILITPRSLTREVHPALRRLQDAGCELVFSSPGRQPDESELPLADALLEGGMPVVEITFRTAAAAEVIRKIAQERPQLVVGAGTVLTSANLEAAKASGARPRWRSLPRRAVPAERDAWK